jgi:alpha-galactosidase
MDMLEIGNGGLNLEESRTHFALWAAMKSPLLIGTQLDKISPEMLNILLNKYLIAFNQDWWVGEPATPYKWGTNPNWTWNSTHPAEYYSGKSSNGTLVLMMNVYDHNQDMIADWGEIPSWKAGASYNVVDAWTGTTYGCVENGAGVTLLPHDTAVLLVQGECGTHKAPWWNGLLKTKHGRWIA